MLLSIHCSDRKEKPKDHQRLPGEKLIMRQALSAHTRTEIQVVSRFMHEHVDHVCMQHVTLLACWPTIAVSYACLLTNVSAPNSTAEGVPLQQFSLILANQGHPESDAGRGCCLQFPSHVTKASPPSGGRPGV